MRNDTDRKCVLVLEAQAKAAVPIIESCAAYRLYVVAGSSRRYCAGFYTRGTRKRVVYPSPSDLPDAWIKFLINFLKENHISAMFPIGHLVTDLVAQHQDEIRKYTRFILPAYDIFVQGLDKTLTLKAAARSGCPIPKTWYPQDQPLEQIAREASYPILLKPAVGVGARGVTLCNSSEELLDKFGRIKAQFGSTFVQEFIPQTSMQYKVDAIVDHAQNLLAGVVYAKLRYYPHTGGSSILNRTEYRPDILESAVRVLKELKWEGFCDFDFITDPRDNLVKLLEINPRYPESYRATVAAGVDMTRIMYQLAKGQKPSPQLEYQDNRYLRFLFGDIMWLLTTKTDRWRAKPSFFDFFRQDTIYHLIRANDLGPILGYILDNLCMLWDKEAREFKLRTRNV